MLWMHMKVLFKSILFRLVLVWCDIIVYWLSSVEVSQVCDSRLFSTSSRTCVLKLIMRIYCTIMSAQPNIGVYVLHLSDLSLKWVLWLCFRWECMEGSIQTLEASNLHDVNVYSCVVCFIDTIQRNSMYFILEGSLFEHSASSNDDWFYQCVIQLFSASSNFCLGPPVQTKWMPVVGTVLTMIVITLEKVSCSIIHVCIWWLGSLQWCSDWWSFECTQEKGRNYWGGQESPNNMYMNCSLISLSE